MRQAEIEKEIKIAEIEREKDNQLRKCETQTEIAKVKAENPHAGMKWEKSDWAILIDTAVFGKAATVIAAMSQENKFDYDEVKSVILKAYELRPEAYRQKLRNYRKNEKQTFVELFCLISGSDLRMLTQVMII